MSGRSFTLAENIAETSLESLLRKCGAQLALDRTVVLNGALITSDHRRVTSSLRELQPECTKRRDVSVIAVATPDPLILDCLHFKKKKKKKNVGNNREKKTRIFLSLPGPENPWKGEQKRTEKQVKSSKKKKQELQALGRGCFFRFAVFPLFFGAFLLSFQRISRVVPQEKTRF